MFYLIIAILSGTSIVLARVINARLAEKIGVFQGTFFNFFMGLIGSVPLLLLNGQGLSSLIAKENPVALWAYCGGLVGVVIIALSSYLSFKLSAFYVTLLLFIGQLFTGVLIDYIISHTFSAGQIIGGILVLIGLGYNLWVDKNEKCL